MALHALGVKVDLLSKKYRIVVKVARFVATEKKESHEVRCDSWSG
jgi:hypothetical protein